LASTSGANLPSAGCRPRLFAYAIDALRFARHARQAPETHRAKNGPAAFE